MAAVSCSILSPGSLNLHATRAQTEVRSSSRTSSRIQLAWDPLQNSTAFRNASSSSSCTHLSSSFSGEQLLCRGSRMHRAARWTSLKASSPRASGAYDEDDEESTSMQQAPEFREAADGKVEESELGKNWMANLMGSAAKPAVVALLVAMLAAQPSEDALAAGSAGRMGGKSFSKPSAPPSRSYSPGGGGGGGRSYGGGGGGGGGMYVAPPTYGFGSPFGYSPFGYSPFYGGGYGGGAFLGPPIGFGGGGAIILAMIAFGTLRSIVGAIRNRFGRDQEEDEDRFD